MDFLHTPWSLQMLTFPLLFQLLAPRLCLLDSLSSCCCGDLQALTCHELLLFFLSISISHCSYTSPFSLHLILSLSVPSVLYSPEFEVCNINIKIAVTDISMKMCEKAAGETADQELKERTALAVKEHHFQDIAAIKLGNVLSVRVCER